MNKNNSRTMACLFVRFEDYKNFCEQINRPDLIYYKTVPSIDYSELKKSLKLKEVLEDFYE